MEITAEMVKSLRQQSGAGIMECKNALKESNGEVEGAVTFLRKKGLAKADKKADRETSEGTVSTYIHPGSKVGVMAELLCETDFVANTTDFQQLARDICMHIAAANPQSLTEADLDPNVLEREKNILTEQARESGKPEAVIEKMIVGRVKKFLGEITLLGQAFVINPDLTVAQAAKEAGVEISAFVRLEVGDGIAKKEEDFASEVAKVAQS